MEFLALGDGAGCCMLAVDVMGECIEGASLGPPKEGPGVSAWSVPPFSISSLNPNFNSGGTSSPLSTFFPSLRTFSASSRRISSPVFPPHPEHRHRRLSLANRSLSSFPISIPPTCPLAPPSINARSAHKAVRIPHAGCHVSSWCPLILRQISRLTSKRPDGVRKRNDGGRRGYDGGRVMRPW